MEEAASDIWQRPDDIKTVVKELGYEDECWEKLLKT
jgi:hypothetical protein